MGQHVRLRAQACGLPSPAKEMMRSHVRTALLACAVLSCAAFYGSGEGRAGADALPRVSPLHPRIYVRQDTAKIGSGHRFAVARTAVVHLPPIDQLALPDNIGVNAAPRHSSKSDGRMKVRGPATRERQIRSGSDWAGNAHAQGSLTELLSCAANQLCRLFPQPRQSHPEHDCRAGVQSFCQYL